MYPTAVAVFACLLAMQCPLGAQQVTWVTPAQDCPLGLKIESTSERVLLTVADAETGQPVTSVEQLGWKFEPFELADVLYASGEGKADTHPVKLTISGLPPGMHKVYLRYWSKMYGPDQQWYIMMAALGDEKPKWRDWEKWDTLISGLGGTHGGVYELVLGTVGTAEAPTTDVTVTFDRWVWGRIARFGGVRIESTPDTEMPQTTDAYLTNQTRPIRKMLLNNGPTNEDGAPAYGLACTSSLVKVRPKYLESLVGAPLDNKITLAGALDEWVNAQFVVFSPDHDLTITSLKVGELTHIRTGDTIAADEITVAPVGFLFNDLSHDPDTHGWWPEPIMTFLDTFTIQQGDLQPVWYRVHIPRDVPAGIYRGTVTLAPEGSPSTTVPVTLTVWDFALPEVYHLKTAFNAGRLVDYPQFVMEYRVNPWNIYDTKSPTREDLTRWAEDGRINAFNVRYIWRNNLDPATGKPRPDDMAQWLEQIDQCLTDARAVGLEDKAYVYLFDEALPGEYEVIDEISQAIRRRFPDLLLMTTAHIHLANTDPTPAVNGWCPRINQYPYDRVRQARKDGKHVWWYVCNTPRAPFPNLTVLEPAINHRLLMGFMSFAYNSEGFLYYSMTYGWPRPPITAGPYVRDQWQVWNRGDGNLAQLGPDGPLPNIRLEAMRDGLEDYEYLYLARSLADTLGDLDGDIPGVLKVSLEQIQPYFDRGNPVVRSTVDYTNNAVGLERAREQLARFIVQGQKILKRQDASR